MHRVTSSIIYRHNADPGSIVHADPRGFDHDAMTVNGLQSLVGVLAPGQVTAIRRVTDAAISARSKQVIPTNRHHLVQSDDHQRIVCFSAQCKPQISILGWAMVEALSRRWSVLFACCFLTRWWWAVGSRSWSGTPLAVLLGIHADGQPGVIGSPGSRGSRA